MFEFPDCALFVVVLLIFKFCWLIWINSFNKFLNSAISDFIDVISDRQEFFKFEISVLIEGQQLFKFEISVFNDEISDLKVE